MRACEALVREGDPDRFFATLFAPADKRPHLLALYAFSLEIARVREQRQRGRCRARSACNGGATRCRARRAATSGRTRSRRPSTTRSCASACRATRSSTSSTRASFDLYDDPMPTLNDLEGYCGETSSALIRLASLVLADGGDPGLAGRRRPCRRRLRADRPAARVSLACPARAGLSAADLSPGTASARDDIVSRARRAGAWPRPSPSCARSRATISSSARRLRGDDPSRGRAGFPAGRAGRRPTCARWSGGTTIRSGPSIDLPRWRKLGSCGGRSGGQLRERRALPSIGRARLLASRRHGPGGRMASGRTPEGGTQMRRPL